MGSRSPAFVGKCNEQSHLYVRSPCLGAVACLHSGFQVGGANPDPCSFPHTLLLLTGAGTPECLIIPCTFHLRALGSTPGTRCLLPLGCSLHPHELGFWPPIWEQSPGCACCMPAACLAAQRSMPWECGLVIFPQACLRICHLWGMPAAWPGPCYSNDLVLLYL